MRPPSLSASAPSLWPPTPLTSTPTATSAQWNAPPCILLRLRVPFPLPSLSASVIHLHVCVSKRLVMELLNDDAADAPRFLLHRHIRSLSRVCGAGASLISTGFFSSSPCSPIIICPGEPSGAR
ncbi:hypothetical protein B0H11DRAFT_2259128 [Mycena galericulata]|nr:hypothetical protein B0H11DRAFT_2259128 [Mycena galericulata]